MGQIRPKAAQAAIGQTHPKSAQAAIGQTCPKAAQAAERQTCPEAAHGAEDRHVQRQHRPANGQTIPKAARAAVGQTLPKTGHHFIYFFTFLFSLPCSFLFACFDSFHFSFAFVSLRTSMLHLDANLAKKTNFFTLKRK